MNLYENLVSTFNNNQHMIADYEYSKNCVLCPPSHITQKAQLEIFIDLSGNFIRAKAVDEEDAQTIIPATEKSASRSSTSAPHALCDQLQYIAGDLKAYTTTVKEQEKFEEHFNNYVSDLKNWNDSSYSDEKITAVYSYIQRRRVIGDLLDEGIIQNNESTSLLKEKIAKTQLEKCMARFIIVGSSDPCECWKDSKLMEKYNNYYLSKISTQENTIISFIDGSKGPASNSGQKGILPYAYGAKLMSANDNSGFSYRGRFDDAKEAYTVDYISSQKAHCALAWLAKLQGYTVGDSTHRTFVIWNNNNNLLPNINNLELLDEDENYPLTKPEYREKYKKYLNGYRSAFKPSDEVTCIGLEAATTGRLSIVYYNQFNSFDFFDRIEQWLSTCNWLFTGYSKKNDKNYKTVLTPSINKIVKYSFGNYSNGRFILRDDLFIKGYQRIRDCILNHQKIPRDFIDNICVTVSHLEGYSYWQKEAVISTACSLINKYYHDQGREIKMGLDRNENDRNYLYGRLLAVFEKVERSTYDFQESRETNAIRMQTIYCQHPGRTRKVIEESLLPYYARLNPGLREYFRKEICEISNQLGIDKTNRALNELYIVGYWAERESLNQKKENKEEM